MNKKGNISPFSTILVAVALTVTGLLSIRSLSLSYIPEEERNTIVVSFSYDGAIPIVTEKNVTSVMEAALSTIKGCESTSSISSSGYGRVYLAFGKDVDMQAVRLEAATLIRSLYPSLPAGVSYPDISLSTRGSASKESVAFVLKGDLPTSEIYKAAKDLLLVPLSSFSGVEQVDVYGYVPYNSVVEFDPQKAASLDITPQEIYESLSGAYLSDNLGISRDEEGNMISIRFETGSNEVLESIPVAVRDGVVIHLSDIATISKEEAESSSHYRINGLNTLTVSVYTSPGINSLKTIRELKDKVTELMLMFPPEITCSVGYDSSEFISAELDKIVSRTIISIAALLVFVLLSYRSVRYMAAILITIAANIAVALLVYYISGLNLHLYTLAGITVSMGMMIDSTIIMTDYYSIKGNRAVFWAVFGAVATTVVALFMTFVFPEQQTANFPDFIYAISINLAVSLAVAYFFVPALFYYIPQKARRKEFTFESLRKTARFYLLYEKYIIFSAKYRWMLFIVLVAGVFFSFRVFYKSLSRVDFGRLPQKKSLLVTTGLSHGHTVMQLDQIVRQMENYLAQFPQIELFTTRIQSYDKALIEVFFKAEYENTAFPMELKQDVISAASDFGGANWTVSGIDDRYFSNYIGGEGRGNAIELTGYNYDDLQSYAQKLSDYLAGNSRVKNIQIRSSREQHPLTQIDMECDFERLAVSGVNPRMYYGRLQELLYRRSLPLSHSTLLRSSLSDSYDLWQANYVPISVSGHKISLSGVGNLRKSESKINIIKENQSYKLLVCYDFLGETKMNARVEKDAISYMNSEVLPVGYRAKSTTYRFDIKEITLGYIYLTGLILIAMFIILSILFESLRYPLSIIILVPVSLTGLFLVFGLSSYIFDQGGFSAMILSAGITVNAGIYLLWTYRRNLGEALREQHTSNIKVTRIYIKSFMHEIRPVLLTIVSTVIGLIPFLLDGPQEAFWFDFALGVICSLVFSLLAIILYLPVFAFLKRKV